VKRGRGAQIAALGLCLFGGACSAVLGLNDYEDAAGALCQCPGFEQVKDCEGYGQKQLMNASPEAQKKWFEKYSERKCGELCDRADECYNDLPGCKNRAAGCECCVWNDVVLECSNDTCKDCRTCFDIVTRTNMDVQPCVSSTVLFTPVEDCACDENICLSSCIGFCSQGEALSGDVNMPDMCTNCLMTSCGAALQACIADKAGT
jgi:hypothetical protein